MCDVELRDYELDVVPEPMKAENEKGYDCLRRCWY
jgi:hypothetical protein